MPYFVVKTVMGFSDDVLLREVVFNSSQEIECYIVANALKRANLVNTHTTFVVLNAKGVSDLFGGPRFMTVSNVLDARYIASSLTYRVNTDKTLTREQRIDMGSLAATYADMCMVK